jgi:hypothetical protein
MYVTSGRMVPYSCKVTSPSFLSSISLTSFLMFQYVKGPVELVVTCPLLHLLFCRVVPLSLVEVMGDAILIDQLTL